MRRKTLPRLDRTREIVMPLANLRRRMLEDAWNQPDLLRCVHCQEGRCCSPEIMETHCLSELGMFLPNVFPIMHKCLISMLFIFVLYVMLV
jgi:hypothetical protein